VPVAIESKHKLARLAMLASACIVFLLLAFIAGRRHPSGSATQPVTPPSSPLLTAPAPTTPDSVPTTVYAHNLMLRKGPNFRIYVRWLRGNMVRTRPDVNPTFDDTETFYLDVKSGVIRANIGDIGGFLNAGGAADSPLKNIKLLADGEKIKLKGSLRKLISLPVEMLGSVSAASDNRIQVRVEKLSVLKIPVTGLLRGLHITASDLVGSKVIPGIAVFGNDMFLDTFKLLPPPHIRGQLLKVRVVSPDIEEVFGNAEETVTRVEEWRNFLRLRNGTIDLGKLTMHNVDLVMVDLSDDAWFDLDLNNYQNQLVSGYTRMTPQAGLQIFMPDLDTIAKTKGAQNVSMEWMKHRDLPPPPDVPSK